MANINVQRKYSVFSVDTLAKSWNVEESTFRIGVFSRACVCVYVCMYVRA